MKRNYLPGPRLQVSGVVSLEEGGTNADNLTDARINLNIVPKSKTGQAQGLIPLDQFGRFPPSYLEDFVFSTVDLDGPAELFVSETGTYKITNMDSRINYTVNADVGSVSINGDTVTYIAPDSNTEGGGFSVSSSYYNIEVRGPTKIPNTPEVMSPTTDIVSNVNFVVFVSSPWSSVYPEDYLALVEWQFSNSPDFSTGISSDVVIEKIGYTASLTNIPPNTTIHGRVRHKGYYGYWSEWSAGKSFSRPPEQKPATPVILSPVSDGVTHNNFTLFTASPFEPGVNGDTLAEATWQASSNMNFLDSLQEFKQSGPEALSLNLETIRDRGYFVRVKYKGVSDWESDWSNVRAVMYVPIEPAQRPTIVSPGVNTVVTLSSTTVTASPFTAVSAGDLIDEAQWQAAKDGSFSVLTAFENKTGENYNSFNLTGMIPGDTYFFRVRYKGTTGWFSEWSLVRSITYGIVVKPTIVSPASGTERLKQTISFFSSDFNIVGLAGTHVSSDWQLSESQTFTSFAEYKYESTANKTSWTVAGLEFGKTYYVRVRHRTNSNIVSEWSNSAMVKTRLAAWSPLMIVDIETGSNKASLSVNNDGNLIAMGNRVYQLSEAGSTLIKTVSNSEAFGSAEGYLTPSTVIGKAITINQTGSSVEVVFSAYIPDAIGAVPKSLLAFAKYGYANGVLTRTEHYVTGNPLVELSDETDFEASTPLHNFEVVGVQAVDNIHTRLLRLKSATGGTRIYYALLEKNLGPSFVPNLATDTYALVEYPELVGQMYTITLQSKAVVQPLQQKTPSGYFENEETGTLLQYFHNDSPTPTVSMNLEVAEAITNLNVSGQWMNADMTLLMSLQGSRLLVYTNN